jgi:putative tricarboxylic transport membrane protein
MSKDNVRKDLIGGVIFGAIFLYAYLNVDHLPAKVKMWPQFVCVLGIICCAILAVKSLYLLHKTKPSDEERKQSNIDWAKTGMTVLVVAIWLEVMDYVGFLLSTIPALFLLMLIPCGKRSKKQYLSYLCISVAFSIVLYVSFGILLRAKLPVGYWF